MKKLLASYLRQYDALIASCENGASPELDNELETLLNRIAFMQHERLIHLLVTLTFAILTVGVVFVLYFSFSIPVCALFIALVCLLVPYIFHYYTLENGVQKLYAQYDRLRELQLKGKQ